MKRLGFALLALLVLRGDMYQDMSNAVGGKRAGTFYAPAFGSCTWDATHDTGGCINQAIEAAHQAGGGMVVLPVGTAGVSTPITTSYNNIGIGCGAPGGSRAASDPYNYPPVAEPATGCELKWIGPSDGRIMSFAAADDTQFIVGAKVDNVRFNGNNGLAADGLYLRSSHGGEFTNLRFVGGFNGGNVINLDVVPGDHHVPHGSQWNHFTNTDVINWKYTSNGIKLGFYQSANPGSIGANASLNTFDQLHIYTGNGATGKAIWCWGCDNNRFNMAYVATDTGGTSIDLDIYTDNGHWFPAIGNFFDHVAYNSAVARGKTTYPTCTGMTAFPSFGNCTWGNEFRKIDGSNGVPNPTIEPGVYLKYSYDYGMEVNAGGAFLAGDGQRAAQTVMGGVGGLHPCNNDSYAYGAGVGSHYCFGAGQTALLFSNASTTVGQQDHFTVSFVGTPGAEHLRFGRPLGTGIYLFDDAPIKLTLPTSCTGLPSGTLRNNAGVVNVCP